MGRRICVVTGSRAEYGLLSGLIGQLDRDSGIDLKIVVTGAHLSPEFGLTYREIEADGFGIDAKVEMLPASDTASAVAKSIGLGVIGFAEAFDGLSPDLLVLLGDRIEILAAAETALVSRIPIAHIHGGERSEGVIDEAIRHAVTKMAHLHFVAAEPYRRRVIQLGENPARVFTVGALGVDNIVKQKHPTRARLGKELGFDIGDGVLLLVTYHPATLSDSGPEAPMKELLSALDCFADAKVIFTKANADEGGRLINRMIDEYAARSPQRVYAAASLGNRLYLAALNAADAVVGNSSSGIIEAPALGKPTVNLGDRQRGRLRVESIIDCEETEGAIRAAVETALTPAFRSRAAAVTPPYGEGRAAEEIHRRLAAVSLDGLLDKTFHDVSFAAPSGEVAA